MPSTIVASRRRPISVIRAAFDPSYATLLVHDNDFIIWRRGLWLAVRDLETRICYVVRLYEKWGRDYYRPGKYVLRYQVYGPGIRQIPRLFELLRGNGAYDDCPSALDSHGCLYLNRVIAVVAGLHLSSGYRTISFVRGRDKALNFVVHHKDGDTTNDMASNLQVMTEADHDAHHNLMLLKASLFVPIVGRIPTRASAQEKVTPSFEALSIFADHLQQDRIPEGSSPVVSHDQVGSKTVGRNIAGPNFKAPKPHEDLHVGPKKAFQHRVLMPVLRSSSRGPPMASQKGP